MLRNARTRIILVGALLSGLASAVVLGMFYWTTQAIVAAETRQVVTTELTGLEDDYRALGVLGLARAIDRRMTDAAERDAVYLLTDARGRVITGNLRDWPSTVVPGSGWVELGLLRTDSNRRVNVSAASLQLPGGERLLVGRDSAGQERFASALFQAGALALIAALALSVATGWMLSRLVFNRVAQIARTADTIVSGDLGQRVPLSGSGDEIDSLSLTLNRMLDRIEALVSNLRTTTDSLAHDLRSPLTRLRAQVALLVDPDLSPQDRGEIADRAQTEADHLLRVFSALTEISRAEAGLSRENFEIVDLARLAGDICDIYGPVGAERDVRIELHSTPVTLSGHAPLIAQALSNLLENALRYAPDGTVIAVTVGQAGRPCLSVADNGPGIPADQHQRVLTPFVTLDESRSARGTGLGLALVASVARLHDGQITLHDNAPGLKAVLCLGATAGAGQAPTLRPPESW